MNTPSPSLLKALNEADWEDLLPRLVDYAEWRLFCAGWLDGRHQEPNRMSAKEAVDIAVERCLTGRRRWNEENPPDLAAFLCGVIKSLVSDELKAFTRDKADLVGGDIEEVADPAATGGFDGVDEADGTSAICDAVEACVKGDEDLELYRLAVLDGNTNRDDIAAALGWAPAKVSAQRIKLQRRLLSQFPGEFAAIKNKRRAS